MRFETHVELGARSYKPNEGMYTVRGNDSTELSFEEVARAARKLGFQLRPWVDRQENQQQVGDRITEIMEELTGTRTVEVPNKGGNTPQTETRVRAHQTDARHQLKRSNAGHVVNWDIMHQTVPQRVLNSLSRQR